jgi:hypothetical protein
MSETRDPQKGQCPLIEVLKSLVRRPHVGRTQARRSQHISTIWAVR